MISETDRQVTMRNVERVMWRLISRSSCFARHTKLIFLMEQFKPLYSR